MTIALRYAARSDVGLVRANNQDSAYAGPHLLVVADGMGGHAGGDVASSIAVAHLAPLDDEAHGPDDALDELNRALGDAHDELLGARHGRPRSSPGLGTTVTALLRAGNKLAMAHIGDSRAYLLRDGELTQVTSDHSFVQHLVNTGKITAEEAEHHPQRSVLLRVLGDFDMELVPDVSVREARVGDRWMLCSDGLSGVVSRDTIAETLPEVDDVGACADQLVQLALRGGAPDNVTVRRRRRRRRRRPARRRRAARPAPQVVGSAATDRQPARPAAVRCRRPGSQALARPPPAGRAVRRGRAAAAPHPAPRRCGASRSSACSPGSAWRVGPAGSGPRSSTTSAWPTGRSRSSRASPRPSARSSSRTWCSHDRPRRRRPAGLHAGPARRDRPDGQPGRRRAVGRRPRARGGRRMSATVLAEGP